MRFALMFAVAWLLFPVNGTAQAKKPQPKRSATDLERALQSKKGRMAETRKELRATKVKERNITSEIHRVEGDIERTENRLETTQDRLSSLRADNRILERRIDETERRLSNRKRILATRLRHNYTQGKTGYVQVLLRSRSIHDYLSRSHYVQRIVESDSQLIGGIREDRAHLQADQTRLKAQIGEVEQLASGLTSLKSEYSQHVAEKRSLLGEVRQDRRKLESVLDQLEQDSRNIQAALQAMQRTPKGRQRMLRPWSGSFGRPADGPTTSRFGMRFHPILKRNRMHTGVDIGAGYGQSIYAAGDGEVVHSSRFGGYGNCVIVDHGGGVTTLYAHCSALLVRVGQQVKKGQTIARIGSTGLATGPHLHFEVRHGGTPVNPIY